MSESTAPAACTDAEWAAAAEAGLPYETPGTNAFDAALHRYTERMQMAAYAEGRSDAAMDHRDQMLSEGAQAVAYAEGRKDEREEQETFLRDLLWGEVQQCCGSYETGYGGEYMGEREVVPVCCGCPDFERNDDAQILAVLRARVPDPAICQTCHAAPIPGHIFCPDCKDEWTA